jgi:predicted phosphodiesterase
MIYGIFSDIHANLEAMEVVYQSMKQKKVEEYFCLGDLVGYHANPNEVIDLIREMNCWKIILGNHDAACIERISMNRFNEPAQKVLEWTRKQLTESNFQFLNQLILRCDVGDITLVHSSPFQSEEWHYLSQLEDLEKNFRYFQGNICFFGHVHKPMIAEQASNGEVKLINQLEYTLKPHCRYLVNVGSVGQARDGNPQTAYVLYDSQSHQLLIQRLDYDFRKTAQKVRDVGLPEYFAQRLLLGK